MQMKSRLEIIYILSFIIYINYLDSGLKSLLSKFVDVTKPGGKYIAEKGVIRFKKF